MELVEVDALDVDIGRDARCGLCLHHPSVAPRHARVLLRRGRLILADLGLARGGTTRGAQRVLAPVTLSPGERFGIGEVELASWPVEGGGPGLPGGGAPGLELGAELESADDGVRRYLLRTGEGRRAELAIARAELARDVGAAWWAAARSSDVGDRVGLPRVSFSLHAERHHLIEVLPEGLRLEAVLERVASRAIELPVEVSIALVAHLGAALVSMHEAWGPHGGIQPRNVHLGVDGSVWLLRPGPLARSLGAIPDPLLAPELRFGGCPSHAGDVFALGALAKVLLAHRGDCPPRLRALLRWLAHAEPSRRPRELRAVAEELEAAAHSAALDPTFGHVARLVRLMEPLPGRPLASVLSSALGATASGVHNPAPIR